MKDDARNSPYGVHLLLGLQSKLIYQGTKRHERVTYIGD